jgi:hypothetical protein
MTGFCKVGIDQAFLFCGVRLRARISNCRCDGRDCDRGGARRCFHGTFLDCRAASRLAMTRRRIDQKLLKFETVPLKHPMNQKSKSILVAFFQRSNFFLATSFKAIAL